MSLLVTSSATFTFLLNFHLPVLPTLATFKFEIFQELVTTVWKFHDFSITHILREINFWDPRSAKSAILTLTGSELGFL